MSTLKDGLFLAAKRMSTDRENEREKLSSQKYQEKLAEALGEAINTYLKESSQKLNK